MAVGFVLIGTEPTKDREVYDQLFKLEEVVELVPLFGEYDMIAKVEAETYDAIGAIVVEKIRRVAGVRTTKTLAKMTL